MNRAIVNSLPASERFLLMQTEPQALAALDEDELIALHDRIRRARNKFSTLYRREGARRITRTGGRGKAHEKNRRNADRAEVYEGALADVSRALARAAKEAAAQLRAERIEDARAARQGQAAKKSAAKKPAAKKPAAKKTATKKTATKKPAPKRGTAKSTPAAKRARASVRAKGARKQAKRDGRR